MQTQVREAGRFERILTVRLGEEELEEAKDRAARKLSRNLKIKGFRPGRAPRRIVEAHVGADTLRSEAIEEALSTVLGAALEEADLVPATAPRVEDLRETGDGGLEVDVKVTLWPTLDELPEYRGRELTVSSPEPTDEEVEAQLERLREQFAELETVPRKAGRGDYVSIDLSATHHGRPVEDASAKDLLYEVGSGSFLPGLDDHLEGAGAGDILRFNALLPQGFGEMGGQEVTFQVLVKDVRRKKLPELTDEWVAEVSEFETVAELRDRLRQNVAEMKRSVVRSQFETRLIDQLLAEVRLELPESLVGAEMERLLHRMIHRLEERGHGLDEYLAATGQSQEAFIEELRRDAERSLKTRILLESVATHEDLAVDREEVEETVAALARAADEDPERYRRALRGTGREEVLAGDILRRKAADLLVESAQPVDDGGRPIALEDVAPATDTERVTDSTGLQWGEDHDREVGEPEPSATEPGEARGEP